ncbi:G-protein coupled receptor 4-like [Amia ocellicauda]|uniref:G-protein coupled receptor 4-like n=1 Tax=Amia ocellicauda TaxID=2972642 RepID=UPI0034641F02
MINLNSTDEDLKKYVMHFLELKSLFVIVMNIAYVIIGLPVICLAICGLYRLVRSDIVVPIYIINLLFADLLQIIVRPTMFVILIVVEESYNLWDIMDLIFSFGLCSSLGFMVCIALERYLIVAHPLWYRYHRSVRHTTLFSAGVWVLALIFTVIKSLDYLLFIFDEADTLFAILFFLPFPLLLFFFVGTWRAIAGATSVRAKEKRRILYTLAFVLGTYTVVFLPYCLVILIISSESNLININIDYILYSYIVTSEIICLSALVDPVLYIFIRPDVRHALGSFPCCQRLFTLTNCWTPRAEQETEDEPDVSSTVTRV